MGKVRATLVALTIGAAALATSGARAGDLGGASFDRGVAPLLMKRCLECHSGAEAAGKLDLTAAKGIRQGGDSGPAIAAGKPDDSLLFRRVHDGEMPPPKQGKSQRLSREEVAAIREWIASGATWPVGRVLDPFETTTDKRAGRDWWSLKPVVRPRAPMVSARERAANAIDAFVLRDLESRGWTLAPAADKRSLIRRLSFDVLGLPPSYEEVEAFAHDDSPQAYAQLVERLLASPRYGERWARYWLDLVRYAETCGYERDQVKPNVWKYRDWVIAALNADMPYDRFVTEQLAGDELPDRSEQTVIATGFLRLGTWNDEPNDAQEYQYDRLEDMVHAAGTAFLGLTIKCARCHDHKFDPIKQEDYYRLASAFWAGYITPAGGDVLGGPDAKKLGFDVLGWTDRSANPPPLHLLKKGDHRRPLAAVPFGHLSLLPALDRPVNAVPPSAATTQRRKQLADWIVNPRNPLTARVWANRIWQHHFGKGLVRSPDNFGFMGDKPTHAELLDWLADELVRSGWSTKHVHRLILLSSTYRQSALHPRFEEYVGKDPENRLWWHAERQRLDAEALRDALLAVSGNLDAARIGGPSFAPTIGADALEGLSMKGAAWRASPPLEQRRRSIYIFSKRGLLLPLATTFDFPDTTLPCAQRDVTTVAPQALALLNNQFVHEQSEALAHRVMAVGGTDAARIAKVWQSAVCRLPGEAERSAAKEHVDSQRRHFISAAHKPADAELWAWTSLCHVLLNTNEFAYAD